MNARVVWDNGTSSTRQLYLERNGSAEDLHAQIETFGLAGIVYQNGVSVWNLAKGDYVEVQVNQDTGGDLGCTLNHFAVVMVQ